MSDSWTLLTENATNTTDAWIALNNQECGGGFIPGTAVNEILFSIERSTELTSTITTASLSGATESKSVSATLSVPEIQEELGPQDITVTEGC